MTKTIVQRFMDYAWMAERLPGPKGFFGHALSLAHRQISEDWISADGKELQCRYKVREHSCIDGKQLSPATYLAIIDEVSTGHVFGINPKSAKPGASVTLQGKICAPPATVDTEITVKSKITKIGRTMAFVRAEARKYDDNTLLFIASHIKYLPTGSWFTDVAFTGWRVPLALFSFNYLFRDPTFDPDRENLREVINSSLQHTGLGRATFEVHSKHCNPVGMFHGGCQGILFEAVGKALAKEELKSDNVALISIDTSFLGSGKRKVEVVAEVVNRDSPKQLTMRVEARSPDTDKIMSEGVLVWSKPSKEM